jgi:hypothetical protein
MNRDQAVQIQALALDAADTIKGIEEIVLTLGSEDRAYFGNHFADVYTALEFGILKAIHDRFPDLRQGHEELGKVSSFLKWEDALSSSWGTGRHPGCGDLLRTCVHVAKGGANHHRCPKAV